MMLSILLLMILSFAIGRFQQKRIIKTRLQKISDESDNNGERFYDRVFNEFKLEVNKQ